MVAGMAVDLRAWQEYLEVAVVLEALLDQVSVQTLLRAGASEDVAPLRGMDRQ